MPVGEICARIAEWERTRPDHRSGTVDMSVLQALDELLGDGIERSLETGCGKSTILLSNRSREHLVFTVDDRAFDDGSVGYVESCPLFRSETTRMIFGPTQRTVPRYEFDATFDLAFLDGPHAYPFPELEYYFVYPHLRAGALLVVDDIHIPTIHRLFEFLKEDDMFELVAVVQTTATFRRTTAPTFSPLQDGWNHQKFNLARFPVDVTTAGTSSSSSRHELHQRLAHIEAECAALRQSLQESTTTSSHWQHVAHERRLRTRLTRRLHRLLGRR
jgi:predicted O-methyltransferase YrrM